MREILYIQAGSLANYIGTHFWNTQEQYFTYSDADSPFVEHDVSFREGSDKKGNPTYTPRVLLFDRKSQFGSLARNGVLHDNYDEEPPNLWSGKSVEFKQEAFEDHPYQTTLLEGESSTDQYSFIPQDVKFWSDFNRIYYHPRSMQMLPDVPDWQDAEGDWIQGQSTFTRFAEETDLLETSMRLFLEECDAFQGMQIINDTSTFGSFTSSLLSTFRDEYSNTSSVVFPLMSSFSPKDIHSLESTAARKALNDALFLRGQYGMSLLTIPIQSPTDWKDMPWSDTLSLNNSNYHNSALLAVHVENATIPLRLKERRETIPLYSTNLNARGLHRFGQLGGVFPTTLRTDILHETYDLSVGRYYSAPRPYSERCVTRGPAVPRSEESDGSLDSSIKINSHTSVHVQAPYPLPSSFPDIITEKTIFGQSAALNSSTSGNAGWFSGTRCVSVFTSLSVTSGLPRLFECYARFAQECVDRRNSAYLYGIVDDWDDMKELVNDLWTIHDGYGAEAGQTHVEAIPEDDD